MLALTGCTGKIGGAVLQAILQHALTPPSELVVCTSSDPGDAQWDDLKAQGATVRQSNYDDLESMIKAFAGCSKLFVVSSPQISLDFNNAQIGRERHHINAIRAAQKAGVEHIYYTSLAFGPESNAGVMQAHLRTEAFLKRLSDVKYTILREGLYNESWPLYFGYYDLKNDERSDVVTAGDGLISWTAIADLGFATALVLVEPSTKYVGKTLYLSGLRTHSLKDIAAIVSQLKKKEIHLKTVPRDQYVDYYTTMGSERASVEWWSTTYAALDKGECSIDDTTLTDLLSSRGVEPKPVEETIKEMLGS
jgi:uncharacterized protein YbjT (DUF2867 family)